MKNRALLALSLALILAAAGVSQENKQVPKGIREADKAEDRFEKSSVPPMNQRPRVDPEKLKREADELAALAKSVLPEIDQTTKGVMPKDLSEKLRKIEKLSKRLRSELGP